MTEISDEFRIEAPIDEARWACREAAMYLDWPLLESNEPHRLVLKRGLRFGTGSLARIEMLLEADGPEATRVTLNGRYPGGVGRLDKRTLGSLMHAVRNAVEVTARRAATPERV